MEPQNNPDGNGARDGDRHVLSESARTPAPGARAVGPVDADERIEVSVRLRRRPYRHRPLTPFLPGSEPT